MVWSDYWGALTSRQRAGLIGGVGLIVIALIGVSVWWLRDPFVPLASNLGSERLNELTQNLDRAKLEYRIGADGNAVWVTQSQLGKARMATAGGEFGVPPNVGLELFKETDFSTTDFAQRINYQRALQGELTRTIQTIAVVRSARVHVILADGGLFKRNAAKASAAVSIALQSGKSLNATQVRGIQRLVAASVPEIKIDDVVVLDESGASLTRAAGEPEGEVSSAQLDLKRQFDQYLEGKLSRLFGDLMPQGTASISVDTVLDEKQLRITTDEPIAAHASKDLEHLAGVVTKERQSQRGRSSLLVATSGNAGDTEGLDREYEYAVGHRMEQALSAPGSIKRIGVAVALQGAPTSLSNAAVEQLVASAIGVDRARGDSVAVLLIPDSPARVANDSAPIASPSSHAASDRGVETKRSVEKNFLQTHATAIAAILSLVSALLVAGWWTHVRMRSEPEHDAAGSPIDIEATTAKVRAWLNAEVSNGRA